MLSYEWQSTESVDLGEIELLTTTYREGGEHMGNLDKLNDRIRESGVKKTVLADAVGMTYITLNRRLNGEGDFTTSQVVAISKFLHLTASERNEIFFD